MALVIRGIIVNKACLLVAWCGHLFCWIVWCGKFRKGLCKWWSPSLFVNVRHCFNVFSRLWWWRWNECIYISPSWVVYSFIYSRESINIIPIWRIPIHSKIHKLSISLIVLCNAMPLCACLLRPSSCLCLITFEHLIIDLALVISWTI